MRWRNKGHEFDQKAQELLAIQNVGKKCYIFGAGIIGKELLITFLSYNYDVAFIDNSTDKQGTKVDEIDVISLEDYLRKKDAPIVIAASIVNTPLIKKQLEGYSLIHGVDFWLYYEFINHIFPIISTYYHNKSYVSLAQITLTERCTLKCKKCAHGCFAVDNKTSIDLTLEQVYKSADSFFAKVDFINEFVLIGGEPLLYKELMQAIIYIGEKYRSQIGIYSITTNGTIIPDKTVLNACKKYNVLIRISNYTKQIPRLKDRYAELTAILEKNGIAYVLGKEEYEWIDYGFDYVNRSGGKEELMEVFDKCKTLCREVRENKFYYCVMARSVSDNLGYHIGQDDYLDLEKLNQENYKKELLEFTLGYSEKGYLDMCRHCNGGGQNRSYPIPAAEQVEGKECINWSYLEQENVEEDYAKRQKS